jgi:hypothetical protein
MGRSLTLRAAPTWDGSVSGGFLLCVESRSAITGSTYICNGLAVDVGGFPIIELGVKSRKGWVSQQWVPVN